MSGRGQQRGDRRVGGGESRGGGGYGSRDGGQVFRGGNQGPRDGGRGSRDGGRGARDGGQGFRDGGQGFRDGGQGFRDCGSGSYGSGDRGRGGFRGAGGGGGYGSRGGYASRGGDTKGKLVTSTDLVPHKKPLPAQTIIPWKPLPDEMDMIKIQARPGKATQCEKYISLKVNHFPVNIKLPPNIYHYEVGVTKVVDESKKKKVQKPQAGKATKPQNQADEQPKQLPRHLRFAIHKLLIKRLCTAFEAANVGKRIGIISDWSAALYTTQKLELTVPLEHAIEVLPDAGEDGRAETFRVVLTPTIERIDTKRLQNIIENMENVPVTQDLERLDRVYNTIMKNLNSSRYVPIGRSSLICFADGTSNPLGGGLLNFKGYNTSMEITNGWKPFLNIHIANCATLLNKNVIDVFSELFSMPRENCRSIERWVPEYFRQASDLLSSCKVKYFPLQNQSKVLGGIVTKVMPMSVSQKKFILEEPNGKQRQVSIYDYFVEKYDRKDLHRHGACLELNSRNYVPAEICEVKKGQSINRKLGKDQTTAMLNCSKKTPAVLQSEIEQSISNLDLQNDTVVKAFGVSFEKKVTLHEMSETRTLSAPQLCYSGARVTPFNGVWDSFGLEAKLLEAVKIEKWGLLYTCKGYRGKDLRGSENNFVDKLTQMGEVANLAFTSAPITNDLSGKLYDRDDAASKNIFLLTNCFETIFKDCQIVVVVIPAKVCSLYGHVKKAAELKIGMLTQCVIADNFDPKPNRADSIAGNIILKINSKLGGINHTVVNPPTTIPFKLFEEPVMIVGADVTHGGGEQGYSYAAVTCSINQSGMPYRMHVQAQQKAGAGAAEVIENFDVIMRKCLLAFRECTRSNLYPSGLIPRKIIYYRDGVGEGQFREVLHKEMRSIREACTALKAAYQPAITFVTVQKRHKTRFFMQKQGKATDENAPPGTVVDTDIVHPTENDFFLLSHQGIKGSTVRPTRYHVLWDDSDFSADQIQQLTYYLCYMYVRCNRSVSIPAPTYYAHHAAARASVLALGLVGSVQEINEQLLRLELNKKYPMHFV